MLIPFQFTCLLYSSVFTSQDLDTTDNTTARRTKCIESHLIFNICNITLGGNLRTLQHKPTTGLWQNTEKSPCQILLDVFTVFIPKNCSVYHSTAETNITCNISLEPENFAWSGDKFYRTACYTTAVYCTMCLSQKNVLCTRHPRGRYRLLAHLYQSLSGEVFVVVSQGLPILSRSLLNVTC